MTPTPEPKLNVIFQTCDTGIDLLNGLGEVTNAYITVQNIGQRDVADVQIKLTASDEQKPSVKQAFSLQYLPAGYEITLKLTVDTDSKIATVLTLTIDGEPGVHETLAREDCSSHLPDFERIKSLGTLYKAAPIQ